MERKAALIGCKEGSWIHTSGMQKLRLSAKVQSDVMLLVEQRDHQDNLLQRRQFVGPGEYDIEPAVWTRLCVVDGSHIDALCLLVGG